MATRKPQARQPFTDDDGSQDGIEVPLDHASDQDDNEEIYHVSAILAERRRKDHEKEYLVDWEGYPEEAATWEPRDHFNDPETVLKHWKERKDRIKKGFEEAFDLVAWQPKADAYQAAERERKERDRIRRREEKAAKTDTRQLTAQPSSLGRKRRKTVSPADDGDELFIPTNKQRKRVVETPSDEEDVSLLSSRIAASSKSTPKAITQSPKVGTAELTKSSQPAPKPVQPAANAAQPRKENTTTKPIPVNASSTPTPAARPDRRVSGTPDPLSAATSTTKVSDKPSAPVRQGSQASNTSKSAVLGTSVNKHKQGDGNVMANWDTEPNISKRKRYEDGTIFNLSHQHRIQMKGRENPAPPADQVILRDPATGEIVSQPKPTPSTEPPRNAPIGPRIPENALDGLIPLTCPYFDKKVECARLPCPFLHKLSDRTASFKLYDQYVDRRTTNWPKFKDPPVPCPWYHDKSKGCARSVEGCWYAHWEVPNASDREGPPLQRICPYWLKGDCHHGSECYFRHPDANEGAGTPASNKSSIQDTSKRDSFALSDGSARPEGVKGKSDYVRRKGLDPKSRTCAYWYQGNCKYSEEVCQHAHELLEGGISWLPTKRETCKFWLDGQCKWPEEKCLFAHRQFGQVGLDPSRRFSADQTTKTEQTPRPALSWTLSEPGRTDDVLIQSSRPPVPANARADTYRPSYDTTDSLPGRRESFGYATSPSPPLPARPAPPRIDSYRPNYDIPDSRPDVPRAPKHFDDLSASFDPLDKNILGQIVALSLPNTSEDAEFDLLGAKTEFQDLLKLIDPPRLNVKGLVPLWIRNSLVDSECNSTHAQLKPLSVMASDMLSIFLVSTENAALIEIKGALLLIFFTDNAPLDRSMTYTFILAAFMSNETVEPSSTLFNQAIERALKITPDQFFKWSAPSSKPERPVKSVFLMFGEPYYAERSLWKIYFRNISAAVLVYGEQGEWDMFCKDDSGAIIMHPKFNDYNTIPDFGKHLMARHNVYQLGVDPREDGPNATFAAYKRFPFGQAILVADEIYENHPEVALRILKSISRHNGDKPPSVWSWRLCARRGIKRWLFDLVAAHEKEDFKTGNHTRFLLWWQLQEIFLPEFEDEFDPQEPQADAPFASIPDDFCPGYEEDWKRGPEGREKCQDLMVRWFAFWAMCNIDTIRRFVVVHSPKGDGKVPAKWREGMQHLLFYTPEKYFGQFDQGSAGEKEKERRTSTV